LTPAGAPAVGWLLNLLYELVESSSIDVLVGDVNHSVLLLIDVFHEVRLLVNEAQRVAGTMLGFGYLVTSRDVWGPAIIVPVSR
jgi:hypothetical protein